MKDKLRRPDGKYISLKDRNIDIELAEDLLVKTDGEKRRDKLKEEADNTLIPKDPKNAQNNSLRPKKG